MKREVRASGCVDVREGVKETSCGSSCEEGEGGREGETLRGSSMYSLEGEEAPHPQERGDRRSSGCGQEGGHGWGSGCAPVHSGAGERGIEQ